MARTYQLEQIKQVVDKLDVAKYIEDGFIAYSQGRVVVPPVGEMIFEKPPGDVHIKYGYIKDDDYFAIKIASGFYENYKIDLPTSDGLILLFSQRDGFLASILLDECYLTNVRTAVAGQIVAKFMAPSKIECIGVFGTGVQGRMQVKYLKPVVDCSDIMAWGRSRDSLDTYKRDMEKLGYTIRTTTDAGEVTQKCRLIITATPSQTPLIDAGQIKPGTHITAMGSDTHLKQELDPKILQSADVVVADSIEQCLTRGEISKTLQAGLINKEDLIELGEVIAGHQSGRTSDAQITVADLTGVAVQDIQIAKAVHEALLQSDFADE
ncbi:Ornithine cyclodeaminase (EC [Olavius sp. associated proteobacterium Delta 1]|nr:Ornithine cyclodeaminase (EC [Olavius sp. associated proteobacterium Delta 1]